MTEKLHNTLKIGPWYVNMTLTPVDSNSFFVSNKQEAYRTEKRTEEDCDFYYDGCYSQKDEFYIEKDWRLMDRIEEDCFSLSYYEKTSQEYVMVQTEVGSDEIMYAMEITKDWTYCRLLYDATRTNGTVAFEGLVSPFSYAVMQQKGIVLHGVLLEYEGRGIILTAPSGTGKSTHAHLWRDQENALIINGDRVLINRMGDQVIGYGMPWCGSSGEYVNRHVTIAAVVVLEQSTVNKVCAMEPTEIFIQLLEALRAPRWEPRLYEKGVELVEEILSDIPVVKLMCRPDAEAVEVLRQEIIRFIK